MSLREPSHEQIQQPGSEGSYPCKDGESINLLSPESHDQFHRTGGEGSQAETTVNDGDNPSYPTSVTIGDHTLTINHKGGPTSDPEPILRQLGIRL